MNPHRNMVGKRRLATACALALATGLTPLTSLAQDTETEPGEELVVEEILVTGTRIKGLDMKGAAQAVQVNQSDILESGAENIGQLMQDLPQVSEVDLNPLIVGPASEGAWAVDVRIVVNNRHP